MEEVFEKMEKYIAKTENVKAEQMEGIQQHGTTQLRCIGVRCLCLEEVDCSGGEFGVHGSDEGSLYAVS